ncbi:hypothetical protein ACFL20_13755 [Spirochaetota bacterium]
MSGRAHDIIAYGDHVAVAWMEDISSGGWGLRVRDVHGYWLDGQNDMGDNIYGIKLNDASIDSDSTVLGSINNNLYAFWMEDYTLVGKVRLDSRDGYSEWKPIHVDSDYIEIGVVDTTVYNSKIYVVYSEYEAPDYSTENVHVKVGK